MNKLQLSFLLILGIGYWVKAQSIVVKDALTQYPIFEVQVLDKQGHNLGATNVDGFFSLKGYGQDSLILKHSSYQKKSVATQLLFKNKETLVYLQPAVFDLQGMVIQGTKWQSKKANTAVSSLNLSEEDIQFNQPQTTADALNATGEVYIQKSQLGGGSPMIRGFAANRVLIISDGIRMNNAIFRSGNVQNVIAIDPFTIANAQVIMGPGSVLYGSDAIGGVMRFNTEEIQTTANFQTIGKVNARYSTANQEKTFHVDLGMSNKQWSSFTSFSYSTFDDLRMGKHGPDAYLRKQYVIRQHKEDVMVENDNPLIQKSTGYNQFNILQKVKWKPNAQWDLNYLFSYAKTSDVPRYDRLIRYKNNALRSAEWYYGPQTWIQNSLRATYQAKNLWFDEFSSILSHQYFTESRHHRDFNAQIKTNRYEKMNVWGWDNEFYKKINTQHELLYGVDIQMNHVDSKGDDEDIIHGLHYSAPSRYPNHSSLNQWGVYVQDVWKVNTQLKLEAGLRYSWVQSKSNFDKQFYDFPFVDADLENSALSGSLGLTYRMSKTWSASTSFSTGFRAPNIDDIAKVFDSEPDKVVVPNPDLKPEYIYTVEGGISKRFGKTILLNFHAYHSWLEDALIRRNFTLNGQDYMMYDRELSRIQALQNASEAKVYGSLFSMEWNITRGLKFLGNVNYTHGEEKLDDGTYVHLRHAPPTFGKLALTYAYKFAKISLSSNYNGKMKAEDLPPNEKSKAFLYALNKNGEPYTPAFIVYNLKFECKINPNIRLNLGLENILDKRYRPYASGISAPGRNFVISVQSLF